MPPDCRCSRVTSTVWKESGYARRDRHEYEGLRTYAGRRWPCVCGIRRSWDAAEARSTDAAATRPPCGKERQRFTDMHVHARRDCMACAVGESLSASSSKRSERGLRQLSAADSPAALLSQCPRLDCWELDARELCLFPARLSLAPDDAWQRDAAAPAAGGMRHALCIFSGHAREPRSSEHLEDHMTPSVG